MTKQHGQAGSGEGVMRGLRGIVFGVANNRSIAWGIAKAVRAAGAEVAFTYQGEALEKRVRPLAQELGAPVLGHCDVTDAATIDAVFARTVDQGQRSLTEQPVDQRTGADVVEDKAVVAHEGEAKSPQRARVVRPFSDRGHPI